MEAINDCEKSAYYTQKKGEKFYEKVLCEKSGEEVYSMVEKQIGNIREHYYRKLVRCHLPKTNCRTL